MISMQKTNTNASILIWSIFLSLIISIGFISISTKIHKSVQENINFQDTIKNNLSWSSAYLEKNEFIVPEDKNTYTFSLKKSENTLVWFSGSSQEFINIDILNGGPVEITYDNTSQIVSESYSFSWNLSNIEIDIDNLSGYTLLNISSNAQILKNNQKSIIWKKVWNKKIIKQYSH